MTLWFWILYLYAGYAFAETATTFDMDLTSRAVKRLIYVSLFVAWPILMPWVPKYAARRHARLMRKKP